ncbi:triose-phosphate isomerase [Pseudidiomarina sp.]|uniref:triose-phosphate isomerase n=1 Tax=Pseudidiomarina sp. TaxID=2081707 RepID=UPI00299E1E09|nr:triose-phosphate isomerase [Pseudidiomarina sp.]MDX1705057.1 triose-phosphate isomerase [Pseudidiomarina sp.]
MQRQPLVIANWKMNGNRSLVEKMTVELREHDEVLDQISVVICPPAVLLPAWQDAVFYDHVHLGAQDVSEHASGAHTGEHSLSLLTEAGVDFVLIGHSERRQFYGEDEERIRAKVQATLSFTEKPVTVVLCVGETASQRQQEQTFAVVEQQLQSALEGVSEQQSKQIVIAYEPVWAIGTGQTASPELAQQVHGFIRQWLTKKFRVSGSRMHILYGGSLKADNAEALFAEADIDGGLIGGASLDPEQFLAICSAAQTRSK